MSGTTYTMQDKVTGTVMTVRLGELVSTEDGHARYKVAVDPPISKGTRERYATNGFTDVVPVNPADRVYMGSDGWLFVDIPAGSGPAAPAAAAGR